MACPDPANRAISTHFPAEALERLESIYVAADATIAKAGPRCDLSGRCCDFEATGHVLFATDLEIGYLLARERAGASVAPDGTRCPFWRDRLCTARAGRPLGCRVYFCDPAYRDRMPEIYETYQAQIRALHDEQGIRYRYAPLVETLREIHAPGEAPGSAVDRQTGL